MTTSTDYNPILQSINFVNNDLVKKFPFISAVGSLQFTSIQTQPDIAYSSISNISYFKTKFIQAHCNAIKQIFYYI